MHPLTAVVAAVRALARWLAADREARRRTRRILTRWEGTPRTAGGSAGAAAPGSAGRAGAAGRRPLAGAPVPQADGPDGRPAAPLRTTRARSGSPSAPATR